MSKRKTNSAAEKTGVELETAQETQQSKGRYMYKIFIARERLTTVETNYDRLKQYLRR